MRDGPEGICFRAKLQTRLNIGLIAPLFIG